MELKGEDVKKFIQSCSILIQVLFVLLNIKIN